MPPAMTDLLDIWATHAPLAGHDPDQITMDFLLPTGIYIQFDVPRVATIKEIKQVGGKCWDFSVIKVLIKHPGVLFLQQRCCVNQENPKPQSHSWSDMISCLF